MSAILPGGRVELAFVGVTVVARGRKLLDDVTLRVESGDFLALVGPNGAGKTTLLRCALGLITPSAGSVRLNGRDVSTLSPRQRASWIAWLPQHIALTEPLSARQVVAAARYRFRESHARSLEAAEHALDKAGARALSERRVTELSGGERQRVAIAALITQDTPLVLVDEPANHLDPAQQIDAYELLGELWQSGLGVLSVTHDVNLLAYAKEPARIRVAGLGAGRRRFEAGFTEPELPERLGELFGLDMRVFEIDDRRLIVARAPSARALAQ